MARTLHGYLGVSEVYSYEEVIAEMKRRLDHGQLHAFPRRDSDAIGASSAATDVTADATDNEARRELTLCALGDNATARRVVAFDVTATAAASAAAAAAAALDAAIVATSLAASTEAAFAEAAASVATALAADAASAPYDSDANSAAEFAAEFAADAAHSAATKAATATSLSMFKTTRG